MKGYFFEGDMELTKEWICEKGTMVIKNKIGTNTLLLIKKYGELRLQSIDVLEIKNFPLKLNLFTSQHPAADCICTERSILLVIF